MATASNILKNFNVFIDGRGYAGLAKTVQIPKLELNIEPLCYAGMDCEMPWASGQKMMEANIVLSGYDKYVLGLWGLGNSKRIPIVARGALESLDGNVVPIIINMSCLIGAIEFGEWEATKESVMTIPLYLYTYKYTEGAQIVHDIDVINMKRIVNGVDQLANIRNALGI